MTVGERMKARRKEIKISADEVAKALGVSRSTIFRYEKGDIEKLPTNILDDIAVILKTTPAYLMGWSDQNQDISSIYNQLDERRRKRVYNFAQTQLQEQQENKIASIENKKSEGEEIHTLAAHSSDPNYIHTDEEIAELEAYLDELDKEYDRKQAQRDKWRK